MKNLHTYLLGFIMVLLFTTFQSEAQSLPEKEAKPESINLKLFPNPSNGEFRLEISLEEKSVVKARLFDMTGKLVEDISDDLQTGNGMISGDIKLKDLTSGIYFLRIESGAKSVTKKIIIR